MSIADTLSETQVCERLGLDAWGLATLVRRGDIQAPKDGRYDTAVVEGLAALLTARRGEGLKALAKLDGAHLG